ncbi:MAG TPA: flagellar motor switch protein FliG [bacterium]
MPPLSGPQKAAILLLSLGEDAAAEVIRNMSEDEIKEVTRYMARIEEIRPEDVTRVTNEFYLVAERTRMLPAAPETKVQYLKKVLSKALGDERSATIVNGLLSPPSGSAIERLKWHDPASIAQFIGEEHPQVIAVILANLGDPSLAQSVIAELPEAVQPDVINRFARLRAIPDEVLKEIEESLNEQMSPGPKGTVGGQRVAELLTSAPRRMEKSLMGALQKADPALAEAVRSQMFEFGDLMKVDNVGIQKLLAKTSGEDLVLALKLADDGLRRHFFQNMSAASAKAVETALDELGPTPVSSVEAAQKRMCTTARELADQGALQVLERKKAPRPEPGPA